MGDERTDIRGGGTGSVDASPRLSEADAEALEAFFDAGCDVERVPASIRPRVVRVAGLLGLLEAGPAGGAARRVEGVLRRLGEAGASELSLDDAEALDAWVLAGFDASRVPAALRERATAHEALASLVREAPTRRVSAFERAALVERTMGRIAEARESGADVMRGRTARNRMADVLSVAAVMLIGASVLWPVMTGVREGAREAACASNLRAVARAMGAYTGDHDQVLPMVTAGFGSGTWWNVGSDPERSNSANLYAVARQRYASLAELACPGNPSAITAPRSPEARDWGNLDELSYSYRVMARPERELWGQPSALVVVADRSPVVVRAVRGQVVYPLESSPNHRGRGQHGLMADGTAEWLESPALASGDNIWLPKPIEVMLDVASRRRGIEPISGTEAPAGRQDSFVGP